MQKRVIASIRKGKGSRNSIVGSVSKRDQKQLLDIRQHRSDGLRVLQPTKSGIGDIDREMATELIKMLGLFIAGCRS
jgi:hypothetical protein